MALNNVRTLARKICHKLLQESFGTVLAGPARTRPILQRWTSPPAVLTLLRRYLAISLAHQCGLSFG